VTAQFTPRKRLDRTLILPPLLIGTLGTVGAVALYILIPGFQPIELLLLLIVVGFGAAGYRQGIVRGAMTIVILYLATGIGATFYRIPAPYVSGIRRLFGLILAGDVVSSEVSKSIDRDSLALSFCLLTVVLWVAFEAISRASFRDTGLPRLGILDKLGGVIVHLAIGVLVASLLFNAIGYGRSRHVHNEALLRSRLNRVLSIHYNAQSFWFSGTPPPIYVYDLDLPRER
jgi:uncharacterized membrane protein required for colicin V production